MPSNEYDALFTPPRPRERVHSIASRLGLSPDIADDYLRLTRIESGHNVNVRDSSKGAQGFGQVMPDVPGGSTRTIAGRRYNLRNPDENIEAGLRYFSEGGPDPVERRLYYFGGPRARNTYRRTGRIPNISDGNMTAAQYVAATGAQQQQRPARPAQPASTPDPYDALFSTEQAPPPSTAESSSESPATAPPAPSIVEALQRITEGVNRDTRKLQRQAQRPTQPQPVVTGSSNIGELRRIDDAALQQRAAVRREVEAERKSFRGAYGAPTAKGALNLLANPAQSLSDLFEDEEKIVERETQARLDAAARALSDEIVDIRQEYGSMSPAQRTVAAPLARGGASLLKLAGGITSLAGFTPNQFSDWANKRAQVVEEASALPPLTKEQTLSTLITGEPDRVLEEIERGRAEKIVTGLADIGVGLAQIILLKRATRLPFGQLLAAEAALKANDRSAKEQAAVAAEAYALGRVLDQHLSRPLSAAAFAGPTAVQTGAAVSQGKMTVEDALIQTGIQAGVGAALGGKRRPREPQVKTKPEIETKPETVESAEQVGAGDVVPSANQRMAQRIPSAISESGDARVSRVSESSTAVERPTVEAVRTGTEQSVSNRSEPRKFYHRDFGEVVESPNQTRTGRRKVRVVDSEGNEHVIKRTTLTGRGNERAVPIKEPVTETESVIEPITERRSPQRVPDADWLKFTPEEQARVRQQVETEQKYPTEPKPAQVNVLSETVPPESQPASREAGRLRALADADEKRLDTAVRAGRDVNSRAVRDLRDGIIRLRQRADVLDRGNTSQFAVTAKAMELAVVPAERVRRSSAIAESATAAKKSSLAADRAELDLPELPAPQRKSWQQSLSEAKPETAQRLADEVLNKPRALSDSETASLVVRAQQVKNEHAAKLSEIASAKEDTLPQLCSELETIEREFDTLTRAAKSSGTEKGRTLAAQKLTINQDYDLVSLISRAKAAKGRELTPEERSRYEAQASKIAELETKLAEANDKLVQRRLQQQIDAQVKRQTRRERRETTRQSLDEEFAQLKQQLAQARAETRNVQPSGLAGLDPEGKLTKIIGQMARNRVRAGVTDAAKIVDAVYAAVSVDLPSVSKRDIRDTISGYSIAPKTKRSELQKQLDALRSELQQLSRTEDIAAGIRSPRREGPTRAEARRLPMEGPRKSEERSSGIPRQGPKLSDARKLRPEGPRLSESTERKQGPRLTDAPLQGPRQSDANKLPAQGPQMVEHGPSKKFVSRNTRRQRQLEQQIAEIERRLEERDFSVPLKPERLPYTRETARLERQAQELKAKFEAELHRARRGPLGTAWDVGVNVANIPKTLKSMGDVSALLRQGGYYSLTHPVISARAARDMFRSFTEAGFKNVEAEIKSHPDFQLAKRSGVEFTGVDKESIPLSGREEAYLSNFVSKLPIARQSEQTFVGFLDSQRMRVFNRLASELRSRGLSPEKHPHEFRSIARLVNTGTGRGSLGRRGNQIAPALNTLMFSPRLLASRVQLLNNMLNPVAIARMPPAARSRMIKDNVKFAGTIATVLGLAAAAGAKVSTVPDDADFLKIRIGNSRYDILTGIQQPLRFMWRMARAVQADITGDETYAGEDKLPLISRFARSKASPMAGVVADYFSGEDFKGRKFNLSRAGIDLLVPLYVDDFREALKEDNIGVVEAVRTGNVPALGRAAARTSPSLVGIGASTYKDSPEKPVTQAEKLARKLARPGKDEAREEAQIELDQKRAELRARSRRGEDVTAELDKLNLTRGQRKVILSAQGQTRLVEDFKRLSLDEAATVFSVATRSEQQQLRPLLEQKAQNFYELPEAKRDPVKRKLDSLGISLMGIRPSRPSRPSRAARESRR